MASLAQFGTHPSFRDCTASIPSSPMGRKRLQKEDAPMDMALRRANHIQRRERRRGEPRTISAIMTMLLEAQWFLPDWDRQDATMTQDSESIHGNSGVGDDALPAASEDDDALPSAMDYGAIPAASQDNADLLSAIDNGARPAASADDEPILSEGGADVVEQQSDDETS